MNFLDALGVAAPIALVGLILFWQFSRSRSLLQDWAAQNGFEILKSEFRFFRRGPFFWTSSKGQTIYYVTVRDAQGSVRSGWVRCGGWWLGLWSNKTEVRWDA
jgi:hypothetical protein